MDEKLIFNGINGETGEYDLPPMSVQKLSAYITGEEIPENLSDLNERYRRDKRVHLGVIEGVDPKKLEQTGWGIVFAHDADPAIEEALSDLINQRRQQAGAYFKLYKGADGVLPRQSKTNWLARQGAGPGPADPHKVPYYLLLVGSPEEIPFRFQTQLDVQYAVGRIHFDKAEDYSQYAASVVRAESAGLNKARSAAFFGAVNGDDSATNVSALELVDPLYQTLREKYGKWSFSCFLKEAASKENLATLLGGEQKPALLFSAGHGLTLPRGHERQLAHQGALVCSEWPGPEAWLGKGPLAQEYFFAGDDLTAASDLSGLIAFFFACYGAGTPLKDEFSKYAFRNWREQLAEKPFLANLPKQMLNRPAGGALAVVGHVERTWGFSYHWPGAGAQTAVFESSLDRLLKGYPVGAAFEYFNERYAELSTVLNDQLDDIEANGDYNPFELAYNWTANNDARGYMIIGDPAVRLPATAEEAF